MAIHSIFTRENPLDVLESIVDTAIDGIILIDTKGTIQMINTAGMALFGYAAGELLGENINILMPSPHSEHHHQYVKNYLDTGIKKIIGIGREIEGLRKDGTMFPARLAVSEMVIDGQRFFTGIIHDLTAIKQVEYKLLELNRELEQIVQDRTNELQETVNLLLYTNKQLQQSIEKHREYEAKLLSTRDELHKALENEKELSALKSRFVSLASHEFRTPLSSILSSASLIARYPGAEQGGHRERHIDRIKSSVQHLNNVLSDFLSLSKLDEGHFAPAISRFSLESLLKDLQTETEGLLKPGQKLVWKIDKADQEITSDKNMLRNILYNLLSNAIKYSVEGKPIRCIVSITEPNLKIEVQDEGVGIPVEEQKHIGSRFFRASNVVNIPGTGLGLNIVMAYLHMLNGQLEFTSEEGVGTTITIVIPLLREK